MALECADGTIALTTGGPGTTFAVSGLAFQPKAIFFFWSGRNSTGGQGEATHAMGAGFATGTTSRRAYGTQSRHAFGSQQADCMRRNDACVVTLSQTGALTGLIDLNAINADGFELIVDDALPTAMLLGWIAWGGSDLTDVAIVDFDNPGVLGTQDYATGFALDTGQDDKAVVFLGGYGAFASVQPDAVLVVGAAAGDTPVNATWGGVADDASATTFNSCYCRMGECLGQPYADDLKIRAAVSAWLSTGFRVNYVEVDTDIWGYSALVMKGGRWELGSALTRTDTTNQAEATTYEPKALLVVSHSKAESALAVVDPTWEISVGAATSPTSRRCASSIDKDGIADSDIGIAFFDDRMYVNQSIDATIIVEGAMDLVSFDATPGFTYVMDDADPVASFFWYLLGASAPAGGGGGFQSAWAARNNIVLQHGRAA